MILSGGASIDCMHLQLLHAAAPIGRSGREALKPSPVGSELPLNLDDAEQILIQRALE
ncbi:MAG: hypothetical protein JWL59_3489 [Chthoniobacteraceae bacterium]|nr:hypothetical protein [Chthoniobacteraceae bacterium]